MTHDNVTDIVERLNADADRWMAGDVGRDNEEAGLLSDEAASTIATLRKQLALHRAALVGHNCGTPGCLCHECCREADARKALGDET